jgi:putative transposase
MSLSDFYPVECLCSALGLPRSSYYYRPQHRDESALKKDMKEIAGKFVKYGSRRLKEQLKRRGYQIGRERTRRLMRELDIEIKPSKKPKPKTTDSEHSHWGVQNLVHKLEIVRPEQVWVADITYIQLIAEEVYLAILMDVFTRIIRGWHLSRSIDHELTLAALNKALSTGKFPEIHHSDQGRQYFADAYLKRLKSFEVQISFADKGKPTQNAYAERVIRTIKDEEVYLNEYQDFQDADRQIGKFIDDVYAKKRIHSSIGYLTPVEFEQQWINENQDGILSTKNGAICVQV